MSNTGIESLVTEKKGKGKRKGEPPAKVEATITQNLTKPSVGDTKPLQLRLEPALKAEFKAHAAELDISAKELFRITWEFYKTQKGMNA